MDQSYKYRTFTYLLKGGNHEVITEPETPRPETVFKYYSNSSNSIDALTNHYLYATHPYSFNDSIDSSELLLEFKDVTFERFAGLYKRFIKPEILKEWDLEELFNNNRLNGFTGLRNFFFEYFSRKLGLISLTTEPLNILMWSHYSSESGFMIELDTKYLIDNIMKNNADLKNYCFRPVQYVEELESINMFDEAFSTPDVPFLYMTNIKRQEWKYEDEWRLAVYKTDMGIPYAYNRPGSINYEGTESRKVFYSEDCVKSIVLGKNFFNGKNCSKILPELIFEISDMGFLATLNYLHKNQNEKLFMSSELQSGTKFGRSISKVKLEKIKENQFKLIELNQVYGNN